MVDLDYIQKVFLKPSRKTKFMFGEQPSIADLCLFSEITYLFGMNY